ncbi:MAG: hypothetical protein ACKO6M_00215 [Bacteroidota bacterium]
MNRTDSSSRPVVPLKLVFRGNKAWVCVALPDLPSVIPFIRSLPGAEWNGDQRVWMDSFRSRSFLIA